MKALITGSFDPVTNGHIDLITRTAGIFDEVIVGIFVNSSKKYLFSEQTRKEMLEQSLSYLSNVSVEICHGLVATYCKENMIDVIVKGIRNASDYEYELNMAKINKELNPDTETLFLPADARVDFISSSMVRSLCAHGEDVTPYVPLVVATELGKLENN